MPFCLDAAADSVDHAAELDDRAVAGALDDAAAMGGDRRVDEVAAEPSQTRERTILVGAGESAISDDVRNQDCGELTDFAQSRLCPRGSCHKIPAPVRRIYRPG